MQRIRILDAVRGFAVLLMVCYHLFFTFGSLFHFPFFLKTFLLIEPYAPPVISSLFIFACAYSCKLSSWKRGAKIFLCGLLLSFITIFILPLLGMADEGIYFGILHFLGIAVLLSPLIFLLVKKIPNAVGVPLWIALAIGSRDLMNHGFFGVKIHDPFSSVNLLFPFGIYHGNFRSADYYPIFPYIFVFALACQIVQKIPTKNLPKFAYQKCCPPLEFLGRHAMIIYLLHQPGIYLLGLIFSLLS